MLDNFFKLNGVPTEIRKKSESDFAKFWEEQAHNLSWFTKWDRTLQWNPPFAKWFEGGKINASFNSLDVHQKTRKEKPAIIWIAESGETKTFSYADLFREVKSTYVHFPLLLKISTKRINNFKICKFSQVSWCVQRRQSYNLPPNGPRIANFYACVCTNWGHSYSCIFGF